MICSPSTLRDELVAWQEDLVRQTLEVGPQIYYVWAGYRQASRGHDCSGHVVWWCLQVGITLPRGRPTCETMWKDLEATEDPQPGDLAFYGTASKSTHVMIVMPGGSEGVHPVAGMSGGGSKTTSVVIASKVGAYHKSFDSHLYRRDFLGFRRLPLPTQGDV